MRVRQAALTGFDLAQGSHEKAYQSELIINPKQQLWRSSDGEQSSHDTCYGRRPCAAQSDFRVRW